MHFGIGTGGDLWSVSVGWWLAQVSNTVECGMGDDLVCGRPYPARAWEKFLVSLQASWYTVKYWLLTSLSEGYFVQWLQCGPYM